MICCFTLNFLSQVIQQVLKLLFPLSPFLLTILSYFSNLGTPWSFRMARLHKCQEVLFLLNCTMANSTFELLVYVYLIQITSSLSLSHDQLVIECIPTVDIKRRKQRFVYLFGSTVNTCRRPSVFFVPRQHMAAALLTYNKTGI